LARLEGVVAVVDRDDRLAAGGGERGGQGGHAAAVERRGAEQVADRDRAAEEADRAGRGGLAADRRGQRDRAADRGRGEVAGGDRGGGGAARLDHLEDARAGGGEGLRAAAGEVGVDEVAAPQAPRDGQAGLVAAVEGALAQEGARVVVDDADAAAQGGDLRVAQRGGEGDVGPRVERVGGALGQADARGRDRGEGDAAQADVGEVLGADRDRAVALRGD